MKRILQGIVLVLVLGMAVSSFAGTGSESSSKGSCAVCNAAGSDQYWTKAGGQLSRGVANTGLCWVELVNQPVKEIKGGGNVVYGIASGVGHTCLRLAQGIGEIITCPTPRAKDGKYTQMANGCPLGVVGLTNR